MPVGIKSYCQHVLQYMVLFSVVLRIQEFELSLEVATGTSCTCFFFAAAA